jgi:hypothetical protein
VPELISTAASAMARWIVQRIPQEKASKLLQKKAPLMMWLGLKAIRFQLWRLLRRGGWAFRNFLNRCAKAMRRDQ